MHTLIGWHANLPNNRLEKFTNDFKAKYKEDWIYNACKMERPK